jgi:hypothetical protein
MSQQIIKRWETQVGADEAGTVQVVSAGTCNYIVPKNDLHPIIEWFLSIRVILWILGIFKISREVETTRYEGRDEFNGMLSDRGIKLYDVQVDLETHGERYVYEKHGPAEELAREVAPVHVYFISDKNLSPVTHAEIGEEAGLQKKRVFIIFEDGSNDGKPGYALPFNLRWLPPVQKKWTLEVEKQGIQVRKHVMKLAKKYPLLSVYAIADEIAQILEATPAR